MRSTTSRCGGSGASDAEAQYHLSESGRARAIEALERNHYAGPAPVSLDAYAAAVGAESSGRDRLDAPAVHRLFEKFIMPKAAVDELGAAIRSGRAVLLYGPAGSGKTYLAEHLAMLMPGIVSIPHAVLVGGEIVQFFDPLVHATVPGELEQSSGLVRPDHDLRWVACKRPVVLTGGELSLQMLDLQFDPVTRYYQAPPHIKANGGLLIVDDLGRQLVSPRELMNRWIVPLSRGRDFLSLHTGFKFAVPFDMSVVFSTNLKPSELADEAFLRRFGYEKCIWARWKWQSMSACSRGFATNSRSSSTRLALNGCSVSAIKGRIGHCSRAIRAILSAEYTISRILRMRRPIEHPDARSCLEDHLANNDASGTARGQQTS